MNVALASLKTLFKSYTYNQVASYVTGHIATAHSQCDKEQNELNDGL